MKHLKLFFALAFLAMAIISCNKNLTPEQELLATEEMSKNMPAVSLSDKELLGKQLFFDKISNPDWVSCASCHAPDHGWAGPNPGINQGGGVYRGAVPQRFGNRRPQPVSYASYSPILYYDHEEDYFVGGNFWDGRATGEQYGSPIEDQAGGPFLNLVEQNNHGMAAVLEQVAKSKYLYLWQKVWGEPLSFASEADINLNYERVARAIAAYESSPEVNAFTSKFDYYLKGEAQMTALELEGLELFRGKSGCNYCHVSEPDPVHNVILFTNYTYHNMGVPKNPENPFYKMDRIFLENGDPINPEGENWIDKGIGDFLKDHNNPEFSSRANDHMGKFKVPSIRNVAKKPGNGTPKSYMHNGVFKTLEEVVHFYNTRDVSAKWAPPEYPFNINTAESGDQQLTPAEEKAIVAFLHTLSDGYIPSKGKIK